MFEGGEVAQRAGKAGQLNIQAEMGEGGEVAQPLMT